MTNKPPEHYGREAAMLIDAMREEIIEDPALPDDLAGDVGDTLDKLKAEYAAVAELREVTGND